MIPTSPPPATSGTPMPRPIPPAPRRSSTCSLFVRRHFMAKAYPAGGPGATGTDAF